MDTRYACEVVLNLDFPPALEDLKKRFREFTLNGDYAHPDRGGTDEGFRTLKEAYDLIEPFCNKATSSTTYPEEFRTVEGYLLKDLGRGYDNVTNAVSCETCSGCGYLKTVKIVGDPLSRRACFACNGSGVFKTQNTRRECPTCEGMGTVRGRVCYDCLGISGLFDRYHVVYCQACQGRGTFYMKKTEQVEYRFCYPCEGKGQIRIFNPVFQAGGMQVTKNQDKKKKMKKVYHNAYMETRSREV